MNKISALEAYKISIVLEDVSYNIYLQFVQFVQKLTFLDLLKQDLGDEMSDQQSDEITKAMNEQRSLEQQYAMLVTKRG